MKMISMYNKLCNYQDGLFFFGNHICIRDNDHQMNLKKHTNHLISSSCVYFMVKFSYFIQLCTRGDTSN
jgi:hypothetical protein